MKLIGGRALAQRSDEHASEDCGCFKCKEKSHNHENLFVNKLGITIHCGNATLKNCEKCSQSICDICLGKKIHKHKKNKYRFDLKNDVLKITYNPKSDGKTYIRHLCNKELTDMIGTNKSITVKDIYEHIRQKRSVISYSSGNEYYSEIKMIIAEYELNLYLYLYPY